jgi:hypothetical protein
MKPSLEPCWTKVGRAEQHLIDLKAAPERGLNYNMYGPVLKGDTHSLKKTRSIEFPDDLRIQYGVMVGDVVHNLRSALDHLIAQLVEANGKSVNKRSGFPIFSEDPTLIPPPGSDTRKVREAAKNRAALWDDRIAGIDQPRWQSSRLCSHTTDRTPC